MSRAVVYTTTDDEREAREIAERLCHKRRRAIVRRVNEMHLFHDPLAPRTTDRYAVLAALPEGERDAG
jgi:hypothetical protein